MMRVRQTRRRMDSKPVRLKIVVALGLGAVSFVVEPATRDERTVYTDDGSGDSTTKVAGGDPGGGSGSGSGSSVWPTG